MWKFRIKTDLAGYSELYNKLIGEYCESIKVILRKLNLDLEELQNYNSSTIFSVKGAISQLLEEPEENSRSIFNQENADLSTHQNLWSKTNRIGADDLSEDYARPSTYELLKENFKIQLKSLSLFKAGDRKAKKKINKAIARLELIQKKANAIFLENLSKATANTLLQSLENLSPSIRESFEQEIESLQTGLLAITELSQNDLLTSRASLKKSDLVNQLRNKLLRFAKKIPERQERNDFIHLSKQLGIVTKRWLDPFYANPKELTSFDKFRLWTKTITSTMATIFALGALVTFFVFPPISPILGLISLVGVYGIMDTLFEVGRNLYYGRSPTKALVIELAIAVPIFAFLMTSTQIVPHIARALMAITPQLASILAQYATFMTTKFIHGFTGALNALFTFLNIKEVKGIEVPKSENSLNQFADLNRSVPFTTLRQQAFEGERNLKKAAQFLCSKSERGYSFVYSSEEGLQHSPSVVAQIADYGNAKDFEGTEATKIFAIRQAVDNYRKVVSTVSAKQRESLLNTISAAIEASGLLPPSTQTPEGMSELQNYLQKLQTLVEQEQRTLVDTPSQKLTLVMR